MAITGNEWHFLARIGKSWQTCLKPRTSQTTIRPYAADRANELRASPDREQFVRYQRVITKPLPGCWSEFRSRYLSVVLGARDPYEKSLFGLSHFAYGHSLVSRGIRMAKEDSPANGHNNYRVPVDKHLAVPINSGNHVPSSLSTGRISGNSFAGGSSLSAARQTVARMPENTNIESTTPCLRLQALLTERPKSPMARVRCAWTDIASALSAGHSLKVIHQRLYEDGLEISYRSLARHVNRFRMEQGKKLPRVAMDLSRFLRQTVKTQNPSMEN